MNENELSEEQLRELYDNEEIERFLHLFSAYVTEVQAPETPDDKHTTFYEEEDSIYHTRISEDNTEWVPPATSEEHLPAAPRPDSGNYESFTEFKTQRYIVPNLPHSRPTPPFTFSRLRLATERSYLAIIPAYAGKILRLVTSIVLWGFWMLWWYNLIAPALVFRIFFSLLKRRIFPYPSLEDLRQRREEVLRADEFGEQVSARLSSKASNMKEIWRLFKIYNHANKSQLNLPANKSSKDKGRSSVENLNKESDQTVLENDDETQEVQDLKRIGLQLLEELADLHERIHNIFIWRRPSSSRVYGMILAAMLMMSFLPSKYIVKGIIFAVGFGFWHLTPVFLALSSSMRKRLPPPFADVPTDAEYAMELISQRVAAGLDVTPSRKHKNPGATESADVSSSHKNGNFSQGSSSSSIDWKKWGDRVAIGKSAVNDIKRLKPGNPVVWPPRHPLIAGVIGIAQPQAIPEVHTYPGQHGSTPGLLTLTHNALLFTPLISQTPKVVIPLTAVKGVKKAGLLKGLNIRWDDSIDGLKEKKEDKFSWIGSRDELFARLVGSDGKRWMKV
ncbi:hypothetical protein HYPSUDRAFT_61151 [Hypholoma sublateritium FD-334 SS-4]|uniref:Uncharacterized protein n=1 Tax=Hypholoma sublateritium (strain FD-334 SS-4) TaxID=945553 RepID=A0A0D2LMA0_HYPSF|nr:hypothetical protein HYPSUDRAFT_61151 [Hypholoma sublateritium FD-334 SS-4]